MALQSFLNILKTYATIIPTQDLVDKLNRKKKLKIKFGCDPTAPDIHLGHVVVLQVLRKFQDEGHEIIFLIGDFTAQIGDPSGKSKTRPPLSKEEIKKNAQTYFEQVTRILDPHKLTIRYNSEWLSKMNFADVLSLAGKITLARLIEREDFHNRLKANTPIGFHELLYPLMQGYDSVALESDIEFGGTDQTFNLLMGRFLQEHYGKETQICIMTPLLLGLDGTQKMSKSLGNYVALNDEPSDAYGKLMSLSDDNMWNYFKLLLHTSDEEIKALQEKVSTQKLHPMNVKKQLAYSIINQFWSSKDADNAQKNFEALFQRHDYSHAEEKKVTLESSIWIIDLLKHLNIIKGSAEGKRLIEGGAVTLDNVKIADFKAVVTWKHGTILKVGKHRIFKLII